MTWHRPASDEPRLGVIPQLPRGFASVVVYGHSIMGRRTTLEDLAPPTKPYRNGYRLNWATKNYQFAGPINGPEYTLQWLAFEKLAHEMWPEIPSNEEYRAACVLAKAGVWTNNPIAVPTQSKRDTVTPSLWLKCATFVVCTALVCGCLWMSGHSQRVPTQETPQYIDQVQPPKRNRDHLMEATRNEVDRRDAMIFETRGMTFEEKQEYLAGKHP